MVCTLIFAIFRVHFRGNFLINFALGLWYFPHFIFLMRNKVYPIFHEFCTDFARQLAHANPQKSHRTGVFRYVPVPWVSLWVRREKLWYYLSHGVVGHITSWSSPIQSVRAQELWSFYKWASPIYNVRVIVQAGQGSIKNMVLVILLLLFTYIIGSYIDIPWLFQCRPGYFYWLF